MRWLVILLALFLTVAWTASAEARFVFRDGKWIFVPDDAELPAPKPPADVEKPAEPAPTPSPAPSDVKPTPTPPVEPLPQPQPPARPEPKPEPATEVTPPVEPAPAPAPQAAPPETLPMEKPTELAPVELPRIKPLPETPVVLPAASLSVPEVASVGEKYRTPEPSKAADEAESLVAKVQPALPEAAQLLAALIAEFRQGDYGAVDSGAKKLVKAYPNSRYAEAAQWLRAEAIFSSGDYYKPFEQYEAFLTTYAGSPLADKALQREFQCAEALLGPAKRKVLGLPMLSGDDEALAMLEKVYSRRPTGPLAPDAVFRQAEYHREKSHFAEAEELLRKFLTEFPNHARARQAELWSAQCAMAANTGPTHDDSSLTRAEDTLRSYRQKYPQEAAQENVDAALEKIRQIRAERKLEQAEYYHRARRTKAARFYAQMVVDKYPGTPSFARAQALLGELGEP